LQLRSWRISKFERGHFLRRRTGYQRGNRVIPSKPTGLAADGLAEELAKAKERIKQLEQKPVEERP
jgi:hypothetical protein